MSNATSLIPSEHEMAAYQTMAAKASASQFFTKLGGEGGLLSIMLLARELGIAPMEAIFGGMNCIQGKVEISPRLMNKMIRQAGHMVEIVECTDMSCTLKGIRTDTNESYIMTYTLEDAKKARLIRPDSGWEKYPSDMLFARCISRLARRLFADIISTAYVEGELREEKNMPKLASNETVIDAEIAQEDNKELEELRGNFWMWLQTTHDHGLVKEFLEMVSKKKKQVVEYTMKDAMAAPKEFYDALNRYIDKKAGSAA